MVTVLPKQARFLLAEAIRDEAAGKVSLLGLYSTDEVVVQGPLPAVVPEGMHGVALQSLAILVIFVDGYGEFHVKFEFYDPDGKRFRPDLEAPITKVKGAGHNLALAISPFPILAFGGYRLVVTVDKRRKFEYSFTIRHQDPNARLPARPVPAKPKRGSTRRGREQKKKAD